MIGSRSVIVVLAVGLGMLATSPAPVLAQDCGTSCQRCMWFGREGVNHERGSHNRMDCRLGSDCGACTGGPTPGGESVSEAGVSETEILLAVLSATPSEIPHLLAEYEDRILLHIPRKLLAIRGSGCQADHVTAVSFLSHAQIETLKRLSVPRLDEFLDRRELTSKAQQ